VPNVTVASYAPVMMLEPSVRVATDRPLPLSCTPVVVVPVA